MASQRTLKDHLAELSPTRRTSLFGGLCHELKQPLYHISSFTEFILTDEDTLDAGLFAYFSNLKTAVEELSSKLDTTSRQKKQGFLRGISEIERLLHLVCQRNQQEPDFQNSGSYELLELVDAKKRDIRYTLNELFDFGDVETFLFKRFMAIYGVVNADVLEQNSIRLHNQTSLLETRGSYSSELSNLLGNAIKHSGCSVIRVSMKKNYYPFLIRIHDNGRGINPNTIYDIAVSQGLVRRGRRMSDEEKISLVFQPGITTASDSLEPEMIYGTSEGLGLSIIKEGVGRKGGKLWVRSRPGDTRFYFTISESQVVRE